MPRFAASLARSATASRSKTTPVGLAGLFRRMSLVRGDRAALTLSTSRANPGCVSTTIGVPPAKRTRCAVADEVGIEKDDFVARVYRCAYRQKKSSARAAGRDDAAIFLPRKSALDVGKQLVAQGRNARRDRVAVLALGHGFVGSSLDRRWHVEIGLANAKINGILQCPSHLKDLADPRGFDGAHTVSDPGWVHRQANSVKCNRKRWRAVPGLDRQRQAHAYCTGPRWKWSRRAFPKVLYPGDASFFHKGRATGLRFEATRGAVVGENSISISSFFTFYLRLELPTQLHKNRLHQYFILYSLHLPRSLATVMPNTSTRSLIAPLRC